MSNLFGPRDVSRLLMRLGEAAPLRMDFATALKRLYESGPMVDEIVAAGWLVPCEGDRLREPLVTNVELEAGCDFDRITMLPLPQSRGPRLSYFDGPVSNIVPRPAPVSVAALHRIVTDPPKRLKDLSLLVRTEYQTHGKSKEYDQLKKRLDYFTAGGIFTVRADKNVLLESGLLVADFDKMEGGAAQAKQQILTDTGLSPAVVLVFFSPSGDGLKVVMMADPRYSRAANYERIDQHLRCRYAWGATLDPKTADLSRACFVCHDPHAYLNPAFAA